MQEAYLITRIIVHNPELMQTYLDGALPLVAACGGQMVVRSEDVVALDGEYDGRRLMITRFPDIERFRRLWESEEYQELRKIRLAAATEDVWLIPGAIT